MESKRIHIVIGTKAQLIKMAPIMVELENKKTPYNYIYTGQHRLTMNELQENFNIKKPDINLHEGKDITGIFQSVFWIIKICFKTLFKKEKILGKTTKNDILLTHGDTFSTVLGALIGKIARINVAHVESGLRSFKLFAPFPEEINRLITFRLSNIYFCAGEWAINNLKKYKGEKINTEFNTLYDSLQLAIKNSKKIQIKIPTSIYAVVSIHRFENIFNTKRLKEIVETLSEISKDIKLLFILHEPTKIRLEKTGLINNLKKNANIELRPRYDYFKFTKLLHFSKFVITDGGSNQEECFYLGKPCLLMREATERTEGLNKNVVLSNYDKKTILDFCKNYKNYKIEQSFFQISPSKIIVEELLNRPFPLNNKP
jgi:UDP-N-acetylglucosamine 2-epimerase (non-hydrolysing)